MRPKDNTKKVLIEHFLVFQLNVKDLVLLSTFQTLVSLSDRLVNVKASLIKNNPLQSLEVQTDLKSVHS